MVNKLYLGDNLEILWRLEKESIDLIYLDPPFCTQKDFGDFDDRWDSFDLYMNWLVIRLKECRRLLRKTGVLCLHLDQRSSHYARVELDKLFGQGNLINEVIWSYRSGGASKRFFAKKHDSILVYGKSKEWTFNPQKEKSYIQQNGFKVEKFKDNVGWYTMVNMRDVWPIDMVGRSSGERMGYPTQKPLALLERIIEAFSNKNYLVADFFCGCGTTVSAAQKLGRKWIGIDCSETAVNITKARMKKEHGLEIDIIRQTD